jgi:hypothetical protein
MDDPSAASFFRRVRIAGRRFIAEVAVSTVATLCVTLILSGWLHRESSNAESVNAPTPSVAASLAAPAPIPSSSAVAVRVIEMSQETKPGATSSSASSATGQSEKLGEKLGEKPVLANIVDPVPVASVQPLRSRSPRPQRKTARDVKPSCGASCVGGSTVAAVDLSPPSRPTVPDAQPPALEAVALDTQRLQFALGVPVPPLPIPPPPLSPLARHSAQRVLEGASAVAGILSGLADRF